MRMNVKIKLIYCNKVLGYLFKYTFENYYYYFERNQRIRDIRGDEK